MYHLYSSLPPSYSLQLICIRLLPRILFLTSPDQFPMLLASKRDFNLERHRLRNSTGQEPYFRLDDFAIDYRFIDVKARQSLRNGHKDSVICNVSARTNTTPEPKRKSARVGFRFVGRGRDVSVRIKSHGVGVNRGIVCKPPCSNISVRIFRSIQILAILLTRCSGGAWLPLEFGIRGRCPLPYLHAVFPWE